MLLAWLLSAAVMHVTSLCFNYKGSFENTLATLGFSISIASWSTGIHDLITSFLGAAHIIEQQHYEHLLNTPTVWRWLLWAQMIIYLVWFVILFSKSAQVSYRMRPLVAIFPGIVGFIAY